ncbi:hypothetical protein [Azospirillum himalayense]|uniref:Uncharacterized protein n=1 Tax=Azospirillum himalayense TaxID=654847 RepID=A0ABW0FZ26_9PROT
MSDVPKLSQKEVLALAGAEKSPYHSVPTRTPEFVRGSLRILGLITHGNTITEAGRAALSKHREAANG